MRTQDNDCGPTKPFARLDDSEDRILRSRVPGIAIRLVDTLRLVGFADEAVDVSIFYGLQEPRGLASEWIAVYSPSIAERIGRVRNLGELRNTILLGSERRLVRWANILRAAGARDTANGPKSIRFLHSMHAIKAARQGLGIALANQLNVCDSLRSGDLRLDNLPVQRRSTISQNLIRSAHMGGLSHEAIGRMTISATDNVIAVLSGHRPATVVNTGAL